MLHQPVEPSDHAFVDLDDHTQENDENLEDLTYENLDLVEIVDKVERGLILG